MEDSKIVTTVAATGSAQADYTVAEFTIQLTEEGKDVPDTKSKLKVKVDNLIALLEALKVKLDIKFVKNSLRTNMNVQPRYEYNKKNEAHIAAYVGQYQLSFKIDAMDKVSAVYDNLTNIQEISVYNPSYGIRSREGEKLNKKALKEAWAKVTARFADECEILGLNPADYAVATWEVNYSDSYRARRSTTKVYALAATASLGGNNGDNIELISGQANVNVNLNVGFRRKD